MLYVWGRMVYLKPKGEYNVLHPYTSWIPITAFCVLRNLTPGLRLTSLALFGWLGRVSLVGAAPCLSACACPDSCIGCAPAWCIDMRPMSLSHFLSKPGAISPGPLGLSPCVQITLETYISQFHTWLLTGLPDGQPKLLLTFFPAEYPLLNFAGTTAGTAWPLPCP